MKGKHFKLVCLVLGLVVSLAACNTADKGPHVHSFSEDWATTETHHWHAATCEHGENKDSYAEHADADENGLCDGCSYEVGHTHAFGDEWLFDEENHWKTATCTHAGEIGHLALHADEDLNGVCDVCTSHVHTINPFGFCSGCDKETKPVDENALGSVVYATSARKKHVVGGTVTYAFAGENRTDDTVDRQAHEVEFSLGTNGTYMERSTLNMAGETETLEYWITALANGGATGITVKKVEGNVVEAQPASFDADSLLGYYYAVSTLADGYGAEAVLKALYEASQEDCVLDFNETHDAEANSFAFDFKTLIVHETKIAQGDSKGSTVYNVNYYEVEVSFTYNDDYALTSFSVDCDCYTNDPGSNMGGEILESDVDLDYDPENKTFALRDGAGVDNYTFTLTQQTGERTELELEDGSKYAPENFDLKKDDAVVTELELKEGQNTVLSLVPTPETSYMSFIKNNLAISVVDQTGAATVGMSVIMHGYDELHLYPKAAGEYVITLTYGEIVKTVSVSVEALPLGGTMRFEVLSSDNNAWKDVYQFKATKTGVYTFYLPYGVSAATFSEKDADGDPIIEEGDVLFDYDQALPGREGTVSFTVPLRKDQTYTFCFKFRDKNVTYTVGYDEPGTKPAA